MGTLTNMDVDNVGQPEPNEEMGEHQAWGRLQIDDYDYDYDYKQFLKSDYDYDYTKLEVADYDYDYDYSTIRVS